MNTDNARGKLNEGRSLMKAWTASTAVAARKIVMGSWRPAACRTGCERYVHIERSHAKLVKAPPLYKNVFGILGARGQMLGLGKRTKGYYDQSYEASHREVCLGMD